jgi:hypothetical protein
MAVGAHAARGAEQQLGKGAGQRLQHAHAAGLRGRKQLQRVETAARAVITSEGVITPGSMGRPTWGWLRSARR